MDTTPDEAHAARIRRFRRRHLIVGWWALAGFAVLGLGLEAMHGFKVPWLLDPSYETRRLLWRLAHAHGTLLSLVHLGFAASVPHVWTTRLGGRSSLRFVSVALLLALLLLPAGFFLGGLVFYGGDPGPGILLSPVGAALFVAAAGRTAWAATFEDGG